VVTEILCCIVCVRCFDNRHRVINRRAEIMFSKHKEASHKCIPKRQIYATQKATPLFAATREQAIINVSDFLKEVWNLFTLWKSCPTNHRGLIRFRISDRKFVNHTTEMILWSMILVDACMIFVHTEGNVENVLKVEAMVKSRRLSRFGWRTKENSFYSSISNLFLSSCFKVKIISLHCI
jgi:hypothetical protein